MPENFRTNSNSRNLSRYMQSFVGGDGGIWLFFVRVSKDTGTPNCNLILRFPSQAHRIAKWSVKPYISIAVRTVVAGVIRERATQKYHTIRVFIFSIESVMIKVGLSAREFGAGDAFVPLCIGLDLLGRPCS